MENEKKLKDSQETFTLLMEKMASLGVSETGLLAVACILPEQEQQYKLMEWILKRMKTNKLGEGEILEKAMLIGDESIKDTQ